MAQGWKRVAEVVLAGGASALVGLRARRSDAAILAYHNIVPEGEQATGDLSLHVDQADFGRQLDWLSERVTIVPLGDLLSGPSSDQLRVAITFDDAYRGTMTAGVSELAARDLPATVFVPPGLLGSEGFWWDRLSEQDSVLDPAARDHVLGQLQGRGDRAVEWAMTNGVTMLDLPDHAKAVTSEELDHLSYEHLSLGAHTWSHPSLPTLDDVTLSDEFSRCREALASDARYVDWLAYPYGHVDDRVASAASSHFAAAVRVDGGVWQNPGNDEADLYQLPRINIPRGLSLQGLYLRLAGLIH